MAKHKPVFEHPDRKPDLALLDSLQREHDILSHSLGNKADVVDGEPNVAQQRLRIVRDEIAALRGKHKLDEAAPATEPK